MATSVVTSIKLEVEVKQRVQRLADVQRRSPHWVMREAIGQYLDREERREQLRQDALAAWEHYQNTGLHVTAAEADAWMRKAASGQKPRKPSCHV